MAAFVVPLALILVAAYANYRHAENEAFLRAQKTADALSEHALRTFRSHEHLVDIINGHLEHLRWQDIVQSPLLASMLRQLGQSEEDTNILLLDRSGQAISSKGGIYDSAALGRDYLRSLENVDEMAIDQPSVDPTSQQRRFLIGKRRLNSSGAFEGVTLVSVSPKYFESIYAGLLETTEDYVAMVRADGVILAHVPPIENGRTLSARSGLMQAIQREPEAGSFSGPAKLMDGSKRIFAYNRVGRYPVYVNYVLSKTYVWTEWKSRMVPYVLVCLGATALLLVAAFFSYRRAVGEQAAWQQWLEESRMRMVAEDANRAKDDFIAILAHELRSPLASVTLSAEILKRLGAQNAIAAASLGIINRQAAHLRRLVDDMLDLARITHGKLALQCRPLDLLALVQNIDLASLNTSGRPVVFDVSGTSVWVNADAARVEQMACNLIQNAVRYGGKTIKVRVAEAGEWAELSVQDDGQGIEPGLLTRLWEPFVQGKQSIDRPHGGLGLGLALVRQLALGHGGRFQGHSDGPGKGASFIVALPRIASSTTPEEDAPEALDRAQARVLVVDDQEDVRESLRLLLELKGHEVITAANGEEGLTAFESFQPDIAFVDIGLPGMDGLELARRLRKTGRGKTAVLAALSGYGRDEERADSIKAGFDVHLTKPVTPRDLDKAFRLLSRHDA